MKRIIAMLLSLALCLGVVPFVSAEGEWYDFKVKLIEKEDKCYGEIKAYEGKKLVWEFETDEGYQTELEPLSDVHQSHETAYFTAHGSLYALDIKTGDVKWKQAGVGGSNHIVIDKKGNICVSGYYGPNVVIFSKDGERLYIDNDGSYCWVDSLELEGDILKMHYNLDDEGNTDGIKTFDLNEIYKAIEKKNEITVTLNGQKIEFDQPPVSIDGRTLVPIRAVMEKMGGTVNWNGETNTTEIVLGDGKMQLVLGSQTAFFNGDSYMLDVAPTSINNRTLLPLRFVSEKFGFSVFWDGDTRTVMIAK